MWSDYLRGQDGDHVHAGSVCTGKVDSLQRHGVTPQDNLFRVFGRRRHCNHKPVVRAGWMSFRRYTRELYDRPKASLLSLKAQMVRSKVVGEAPLY